VRASNFHYELAERTLATPYGGIGLMYQLARESGLIDAIDRRLVLLRAHLPYHESDHVLNIAFNALCDGRCLEDWEHRRQDEAYLNALGAERIPDPTTAGDFVCAHPLPDHQHGSEAGLPVAGIECLARGVLPCGLHCLTPRRPHGDGRVHSPVRPT
jgi:hypothetical protein